MKKVHTSSDRPKKSILSNTALWMEVMKWVTEQVQTEVYDDVHMSVLEESLNYI